MQDEQQAIQLLRQGDPGGMAYLFKEHKQYLHNVCFSILKDHWDADDVVQEVFIIVQEKISEFRNESVIRTWMHRIAVNLCLMRCRQKGRSVEEGFLLDQEELWHGKYRRSLLSRLLFSGVLPTEEGEQALREETRRRILEALRLVPWQQRVWLRDHYAAGNPCKKIAESSGVSERWVKKQISAAKSTIRGVFACRVQ
jgi:RNA polymerase sigma-70 factor (ECF subfamily)